MPGKVFLDTNVIVYAQDADAPEKLQRARTLLASLAATGDAVISTQVLQEVYVTSTRKLGIAPLAAKAILKALAVFETVQVSPALVQEAVDCSILNELSFWDSLVLAAAASAGCTVVYSEDLNAGQTILGVKVENPFLDV